MPPRTKSRFLYCLGVHDDGAPDELQLTEREPYRYANFPDNVQHRVAENETLFSIAAKYFAALDNPAQLWWVIADFQPDPIHDPTIQLEPGTILIVPSVRTVLETIFNESRRLEIGL